MVPTPPQATTDIVERMAEAMRQELQKGPTSKFWPHDRRCFDRETALVKASELRRDLGNHRNGRRVRWRIRGCPVCSRYYVDMDGSSRGDMKGQRRRKLERRRARQQEEA